MFEFDGETLRRAIVETMAHREHELYEGALERMKKFGENIFLLTQWKAFEPAKEVELSLETVVEALAVFLTPVIVSIMENTAFDKHWSNSERKWI